jgi:phosphoenolpyruvate carboxykinase (ATP)
MAVNTDSTSKAETFNNLSSAQLAEQSILRDEGHFASNGAIVVETGARTGRSPKDRFIVDEPSTSESIDWGEVNQPIDGAVFDRLWDRVQVHLQENETFLSNLHVGRRPRTLFTH